MILARQDSVACVIHKFDCTGNFVECMLLMFVCLLGHFLSLRMQGYFPTRSGFFAVAV